MGLEDLEVSCRICVGLGFRVLQATLNPKQRPQRPCRQELVRHTDRLENTMALVDRTEMKQMPRPTCTYYIHQTI